VLLLIEPIADLADGEQRPAHAPVHPVLAVLGDRRVRVERAGHHGERLHRLDLEARPPGGDRVGRERDVEEDPARVQVEGALEEGPVQRRAEELVTGRDASRPDVEGVTEQGLLQVDIDQPIRVPAAELGHVEDVADVGAGEAGARAQRKRHVEAPTRPADQPLEVHRHVHREVVRLAQAVPVAADRVSQDVRGEHCGRHDPEVPELRTETAPLAGEVLAPQQVPELLQPGNVELLPGLALEAFLAARGEGQ
jgi:hypothetical protein